MYYCISIVLFMYLWLYLCFRYARFAAQPEQSHSKQVAWFLVLVSPPSDRGHRAVPDPDHPDPGRDQRGVVRPRLPGHTGEEAGMKGGAQTWQQPVKSLEEVLFSAVTPTANRSQVWSLLVYCAVAMRTLGVTGHQHSGKKIQLWVHRAGGENCGLYWFGPIGSLFIVFITYVFFLSGKYLIVHVIYLGDTHSVFEEIFLENIVFFGVNNILGLKWTQ